MHHLVFGINFPIHSVSLTILVSIHLLIHGLVAVPSDKLQAQNLSVQ